MIDDMQKVRAVLDVLMKDRYIDQGVYKELVGVFMKWHKYGTEEKNKQYNNNLCHELNIFIYFKDQEYF